MPQSLFRAEGWSSRRPPLSLRSSTTSSLLASLSDQIEQERAREVQRKHREAQQQEDLARSLSSVADKLSNPNAFSPALASAAGHYGAMDVDGPRKG